MAQPDESSMLSRTKPGSGRWIQSLRRAIEWSSKTYAKFLATRNDIIREYVSSNYGDEGNTIGPVMTNLVEHAVNTWKRNLVSSNPKFLVRAMDNRNLDAMAAVLQARMNAFFEEERFQEQAELAVLNSLVHKGIVKVGLTRKGVYRDEFGVAHVLTKPFVMHVDPDDWIEDMSVKNPRNRAFVGDVFQVPLEEARENPLYDKDEREQLQSSSRLFVHEGEHVERIQNLTVDNDGQDQSFLDVVEILELFLPQEKLIVTLPYSGGRRDKVLRIEEWEGYERGPYHELFFDPVPNNPMPLPPILPILELHHLGNNLFRKLSDQADRQKDNIGVVVKAAADGQRLKDARDGEIIPMDYPDGIRPIRSGGVDQANLGFYLQVAELFNKFGGDINLLSGGGANANTLGQDQIDAAAAGFRIRDMKESVMRFTEGIGRAVAQYLHQDEFDDTMVSKPLSRSRSVRVRFNEVRTRGEFDDFRLEVQPFSMDYKTPQQRGLEIITMLERVIVPNEQKMAQQGASVDYSALLQELEELLGVDTSRFMSYTNSEYAQKSEQPAGKNAGTKRTYERISRTGRPEDGGAGDRERMIQKMMGAATRQPVGA